VVRVCFCVVDFLFFFGGFFFFLFFVAFFFVFFLFFLGIGTTPTQKKQGVFQTPRRLKTVPTKRITLGFGIF